MVRIGDKVPDFEEDAYMDKSFQKIKLSGFKGKWIVLFFYPADFTFVCPTEIRSFAKHNDDFKKAGAVVIGCSTDSIHCHKAWFEKDLPEVNYPVIGDSAHRLSCMFGVLKQDDGIAYRGTFIIDSEGTLRYVSVNDLNVGRSVDETLRILQALQSGGLCPVEWKPGMPTLKAS
jgi:alkyl hydroperoxide reductase subunit AhpC